MEYVTENLCYLLWSKDVLRSNWADQLATWAKCNSRRSARLLEGDQLTLEEMNRIAQITGRDAESIQFTRLLSEDNVDILHENVVYLLDSLEHGRKKELGAYLGIDASTISRWSQGRRPQTHARQGLRRFFGLPDSVDLEKHPIFLSMEPIGEMDLKRQLYGWIDCLDMKTLQQIYPALERLLRRP